MFRPHLPFDIGWKVLTGSPEEIGVLFPMTRLIRGASALAPKGSPFNPTGAGLNIEQPLKAGLRALTGAENIPDWDMWEEQRTDKALADMVGDGMLNPRDALIAMIERRGSFFDEARARATQKAGLQNYSVVGGQFFPTGEQEYYKAMVLRNRMIDEAVASLLPGQSDAGVMAFLQAGKATHPDENEPQQEYDTMMAAVQSGQNVETAIAIAQSHLTAHQRALTMPNTIYDPYPGDPQKNQAAVDGFTKVIAALQDTGASPDDYSYGEKWDLIKANGLNKRGTPLGDFYSKNPAYDIRGSVYDEPEYRLKSMLSDEIWKVYNAKGKLDRRLMNDDLGDEFKAQFLDKETRDVSAVTLDQLGEWVVKVRGYVPQQEMLKPGEFPEVRYATPDQSARYETIQNTKEQLFDMDALGPKLDAYSQLDQDAKRAYRDTFKDVDAYLDWYGAQMRANPDLSQLINPDFQAFTGSYVNTRDGANDVTRYAVSNLENMIRRIGGRNARGGASRGTTSPFVPNAPAGQTPDAPLSIKLLTSRAQGELKQKWANPRFFLSKDVYGELFALYRKYRMGAQSFEQWLTLFQQMAGGR
jgi:hypothetical protein